MQTGISESILKGLNEQQQEAVRTTEGPLLIVAGAGSGKTRVLTHRIAYLLQEQRTGPWNILAITFTNKASREMKERITDMVGPAAESIWISTFHAMCVRILRRDIDRIDLNRNFSILDASDQLSVVKQCLKELNYDPKKYQPKGILGKISNAKNELIDPHRFAEKYAWGPYEQVVSEVYQRYQRKLKNNHSLDFDDLIMQTIRLFQKVPEVLAYYQRRFHYIMVDEYQDTNHAQYKLVRLLADHFKNLCCVGDSDQSIYKWRGADIRNILNFEEDYEDANVIKLEQNYRSTQRILEAANGVIQNNLGRKEKALWTDNDEGRPLTWYEADNEHDEAYYIVEKIREAVTQGANYRDFAVLYRTNAQSRVMEDVLVKSNMPYQIVGGVKFYERKEIKDALAYLRLAANPDDDLSLQRVINVPKRGVGQTSVDKLAAYAEEREISLYQALKEADFTGISARAAKACTELGAMIREFEQQVEYLGVTELTEQILERSGYRDMLEKEDTIESRTRLENIDEFLSVTQEFEKTNDDKSLVHFLTELALVSDMDRVDDEQDDNHIVLMTLHSAKGLEFPTVFLIGMEEGIFPLSRAQFEEEELEEERRLAYVGITRAEQALTVSSAAMRTIYGKTNMNPPSRFLQEIPDHLVERPAQKKEPIDPSPVGTSFGSPSRPSFHRGVNTETDWKTGDKALHQKWGEGTVVSIKGSGDDLELNIAFPKPTGVKKLLAKFAPISKG